MASRLGPISAVQAQTAITAELSVETPGEGFTEITAEAARFLAESKACDGTLFLFLRHTSASLVIQENADPDVQRDLVTALHRIAPENAPWVHDAEGPDDMPAHVKAMLAGISLHIPVAGGEMQLGTWQGIYLVEHRARAHRRRIVLQFLGKTR